MKTSNLVLLDTNILVYYHQELSLFHQQAKELMEKGLRGAVSLCICPQVLMEFYSTITNPKRVTDPVSPGEAIQEVEKYFTRRWIAKIHPKEDVLAITLDLLKRYPVKQMEIFDLQLVATMISNQVKQIYTVNRDDFVKFTEIEVLEL
jgi:predicted nucleic acid-binding protein